MAKESKMEKEVIHAEKKFEKYSKNPWFILSIILAVLLIGAVFAEFYMNSNVSQSSIKSKILSFAASQGVTATVKNVSSMGSLYEVVLDIEGREVPLYVTKDGKYIVPTFIPLEDKKTQNPTNPTPETPTQTDIPKSPKPVVELFVMTHCPYGTQAEKGLIPTIKALGNKADIKIRFVHYFMHGDKEEKETYNQVCIREEQSSKYLAYLECFLATDGSTTGPTSCLTKAGIDQAKLKTCIDSGKGKEYYAADSALSNKYGVQGSPTLIINGVESSAGRSSASYLTGICSAFTSSPTECSQQLSSTNPSPGFGTAAAASGSNTAAQCG
jgi:protein-disulfide isomerase